jgi:hypothetical protein
MPGVALLTEDRHLLLDDRESDKVAAWHRVRLYTARTSQAGKSLFWRDAKTNTRDACATQRKTLRLAACASRNSDVSEETLFVICKISPGENRGDFVAPFLDVCAAAFFSIDQHDDESDLSAGFFDRIYRLDG